ncbi:MAG: peptidylprolyl isomerase [Actinomycetota bacterium]
MSKRSRERQLAKLAARRQAERDAQRHRRQRILGAVGLVAAVGLLVAAGSVIFNGDDGTQASPSPTVSPSASPSEGPLPVACDAKAPKAAGTTKPTFDKPPAMTIDPTKTYIATMETSCGTIVIQLDPEAAPIGVDSFVFLAKKGFFDGLTFHRIAPGFVIQGGDPEGTGSGGPGYQFATETSPKVTFDAAGILAYANAGGDTNGSQFFITLAPSPNLDPTPQGSYTIFGKVIEGLGVVRTIGEIPGTANPQLPGEDSVPTQTVYIDKVTIAVQP